MRKKILVVDDEKDIVDFLGKFLEKFSIEVIKATSGNDAINLYKMHLPQIVFLDINMPDMDGISVLRQLRSLNPSLKVIMITAIEDKYFQKKAKKYGAIDYITKPIDLSEFANKIKLYFK
ncbi:MAG: response regulator [Candidatus Omnitrophica bacterium]|nr:response regulator [Candidatus Omnitrophota bacterium]